MVWSCRKDDERRFTKEIYETDMGGNAGRGRPRRTFLDQIGKVLENGHVKSTRNRRACMRNLMTVEEAKGIRIVAGGRKRSLPQREIGVMCVYVRLI
jgi:hypothetical protein